jgi:peptide/nickel transport system substrate-binding protein
MRRAILRHALASMILLAACAPAAAPTGGPAAPAVPGSERAENQSIQVGVSALPNNLTPQATTTFNHVFWPLYDTLTTLNNRYEPQPQVAERWELSADGLTWRFFLRKDVTWPDGSPLTARDVAFTATTIVKDNWAGRTHMAAMQEAVAVDDWTVEFRMRMPDMALVNNGIFLYILPQRYYESVGGFDGFVAKPVGSGPYELVEYRAGDLVRYRKKATEHPFRKVAHQELTFRALPQVTTQISGLRTGELDLVTQVSYPADQVEILQNSGMQIVVSESANFSINMPKSVYDAKNSPLKDIRVRQALNYAIDKETLVKAVFKTYARAVGQYGTPGSPFWDDNVRPLPYDPARARQLLAEAGYADGFNLTIDVTPGFVPQPILLAVQDNLRAVNIQLEIIQNEAAQFFDKYFGRAQKADLFPLQSGESNGFYGSLRNAFSCTGPGGSPGLGFYCNPEFDRLLAQAYGERDPAKRRELFLQANKVIREDFPGIFLTTQPSFTILNPKIKGVALATPNIYNFDTIYRVK